MDEKYTDDVQKLDMGRKAFLTYDDISQELPEGLVSPDDIEDIFATLSGEGITISDSEEKFLETAAAVATAEKFEEPQEEELELDLTPGALDKTNDPVRLYLREMGVVPLLTREGEVAIAKRIERGKIRMQKAISRSPVAIAELLQNRRRAGERRPFDPRGRDLHRTGRHHGREDRGVPQLHPRNHRRDRQDAQEDEHALRESPG